MSLADELSIKEDLFFKFILRLFKFTTKDLEKRAVAMKWNDSCWQIFLGSL